MVLVGKYLRGEQVRHISPDVVGANCGTVLATFLDVHDVPVAAVAWRGGYMSITELKWLDRIAHNFKPARSFL